MAKAEADVARMSAHIDDVTDSGKGEVAGCCARSTWTICVGTASTRPSPQLARTRAFSLANSSSVSTPWSLRPARSLSFSTRLCGGRAAGGAGACCGGAS